MERSHAPGRSGFWVHPTKGVFALSAEEHHSAFFKSHPELFGEDLGGAYENGWVSVRKWLGADIPWRILYGRLVPVRQTMASWARDLIDKRPGEAECLVLFQSICDPAVPATRKLGEVALGTWENSEAEPSDERP